MSDVTRLIRVGDMTADTDKRTVFGTVMPYNTVSMVRDAGGPAYKERFAPGSFARSIAQRGDKVRLYGMHNRAMGGFPIGEPVDWSDGPDKLTAAFRLYEGTTDADNALSLVRQGGFNGFSVGFGPIDGGTRKDGDIVTRTEAALGEVSLVDIPAYPTALIDGVRMSDLNADEIEAWLTTLPSEARAAVLEAARSLAPQDASTPDDAPQAPLDGTHPSFPAARLRLLTLKG